MHRAGPGCWQMVGLEIFGEDDPRHELRSGQTDGAQEVEGPEATWPLGQQVPQALLASSDLVEKLREMRLHSARNVEEKGLFQAGTENRGV